MRRVNVAAAFAIAAIAAIGVAGCGDDDSTSSTTATLTKEEFVQQANAICAEANAENEAAAKEAQASGGDQEAFITDTLLPSIQAQITAIEDLPVPSGEEEQVSEIVTAVNQGLDEAEADPAALTSGADPFAEANQLANDYGMTDCGG